MDKKFKDELLAQIVSLRLTKFEVKDQEQTEKLSAQHAALKRLSAARNVADMAVICANLSERAERVKTDRTRYKALKEAADLASAWLERARHPHAQKPALPVHEVREPHRPAPRTHGYRNHRQRPSVRA
jgi:hypothetical protein